MFVANLALCVILGQAPSGEPESLVRRLGAPRYAERESAAGALERLGREALPSLRSAAHSKDLEIRTRAAILIDKIEGALLTQPTMVALDFQERPLAEVVKAIREQTGVRLALTPENSPNWAATRITLRESAPLPFWKALDKLCDAAQLQYNTFGVQGFSPNREPSFPLYAGNGRPSGPMVDQGPFRIQVVGLHYQRDVSFQPAGQQAGMVGQGRPVIGPRGLGGVPPRPAAPVQGAKATHTITEQFHMQLQIVAEPRLAVSQSGPLTVLDAVDDLGQSVKAVANPQMGQRFSGYFGMSPGSALQVQVPLTRPQQAGKLLHRFRAEIPLSVSTRKPNPLVVSLSGSSGKTFQNDEVALSIQDVKPNNPNPNQTSVELNVRMLANQGGATDVPANGEPGFPLRPELPQQQQLEILDAQGRVLPWYPSSFDADGGRLRITTTTPDQAVSPSELRFYGLARANTEVMFEFVDVPLP